MQAVAHSQNLIPCLLPENSSRLGRYTLLYRFASGGMANLYAARIDGPDGFEKIVAVKVMHQHLTHDREFVEMFIDEARLASRITHANVVQILELGQAGPTYFIAMEYIHGESVLAVLKRSRLPHATSAQVIATAALGLHAAHELRDGEGRPLEVVHRDVSPDNILIGYDGTVKPADFGVARTRDSLHTTLSGTVKGKFGYMAPEQAMGHAVDRRADVFSLGVVLFEMTTGQRLFRRSSEAEVLQSVIRCNVPLPSRLVPGYPKPLERIVMRALQRNPGGRFQSALELHEVLSGYLAHSGAGISAVSLSEMMHTLFADRIEERRQLLRRFSAGESPCVPDLDFQTQGSSIEALVVTALRPPRWPRRIGVALALLLLATAVALLALPAQENRAQLRPRAGADPPPARADRSRAEARPLNPEVVEQPPATRVKLRTQARPARAQALRSRRARRRARRARRLRRQWRRRQLKDRDVLKNPYR